MIKKGDRFIVLKYGTGIYDCIKQHTEVIDKLGYCWFGKIGVALSIKAIHSKLNEERMYVILYCQGKAHLCDLLEVSEDRPETGYPTYYDSFLFGRGIHPQMFFKLGSIMPMSSEELAECTILSSGKPMVETVSRSMASFFYAEYPEDRREIDPLETKAVKKPKKAVRKKAAVVDKNSCVYRKDGLCTNRRCVNYQYDCDRPSSCVKQKPASVKGV